MMLTDRYGKVRERYEYDAFGSLYEGAFARLNAVGYTGKHNDTKSGRYDYGFLEYSPSLGRFTTKDPIKDGANWYAYCGNEPVNFTDPAGLLKKDGEKVFGKYIYIPEDYQKMKNSIRDQLMKETPGLDQNIANTLAIAITDEMNVLEAKNIADTAARIDTAAKQGEEKNVLEKMWQKVREQIEKIGERAKGKESPEVKKAREAYESKKKDTEKAFGCSK
jgi:RHS repeat-associated protein